MQNRLMYLRSDVSLMQLYMHGIAMNDMKASWLPCVQQCHCQENSLVLQARPYQPRTGFHVDSEIYHGLQRTSVRFLVNSMAFVCDFSVWLGLASVPLSLWLLCIILLAWLLFYYRHGLAWLLFYYRHGLPCMMAKFFKLEENDLISCRIDTT